MMPNICNLDVDTATPPVHMRWCRVIKSDALQSAPRMIERVWAALQLLDPAVSPAPADGLGEFSGDRLHLKWCAQSQGEFFTTEVLDMQQQSLWQLSVTPVKGIGQIAIVRTVWNSVNPQAPCQALVQLWEQVFSGITEPDDIRPKSEPHFLALLGTAISPAGMSSLLDDSVQVEQLQSDLEYWRGLAKKQAVLLKSAMPADTKFEYIPQSSTGQPESAREWRLDELDEWAAIHADKIMIIPRAIAAAKRSHYENPALVFTCLDILANVYPTTKLGQIERDVMKRQLEELGVAIGGSVDPSVAGEKGDQYFIRVGGRRRFLDQHMGKGSARDERFTMRIYFTWDQEVEKVIVGWLPSHLETGRA